MKSALVLSIVLVTLAIGLSACGGNTSSVPATATKPAVATAVPSQGEALVNERCTVCHAIDRIKGAKKSAADWKTTVDRMIGHGARLSADEATVVVQYLAATYK